jgi:hypothetical protein
MAERLAGRVQYTVRRFNVETRSAFSDLRARFEEAVPPVPVEKISALVARKAPWSEMEALMDTSSRIGFFLYNTMAATVLMPWATTSSPSGCTVMSRLSCSTRRCT